MSNIFRRSYTLPIPTDAELIDIKGVPSARFKKKGKIKTAPLTADGQRMHVESPSWYGWVEGRAVKLFTDAIASQQRLAELIRKSERRESGVLDPFEQQRRRRLAEHVEDWRASLRNHGCAESHIRATTACVKRIIEACKFERTADISASRVEQFLGDLQRNAPVLPPLDREKHVYKKSEVAMALGISRTAVASLVKRHRLGATGQGKARRYPKETVEALRGSRDHGISVKTSNLYLSGMKAFCNFLVEDGRMSASPIGHLKGLDPQHDRRHDRRLLDEGELGAVIGAAAGSDVVFRELAGIDRAMLYRLACTSGFRAKELAVLRPKDFDFGEPSVTLRGIYTKNKKPAVQPLPRDVAEAMRGYFAGKAADKLIWPGTWFTRAADMLRIDLDAAGIPYVVEGRDGPLHANFYCLRHSFVGLLDKSGATLKEAMQRDTACPA